MFTIGSAELTEVLNSLTRFRVLSRSGQVKAVDALRRCRSTINHLVERNAEQAEELERCRTSK